jgi:hypothetical protein
MKANEAPEKMYIPEKIYLPYKDGKVIGLVKETGVPYKSGVDGNIEYIRTDAFIEKADEFISSFFHPDDTKLKNILLKKFHEYMEGE